MLPSPPEGEGLGEKGRRIRSATFMRRAARPFSPALSLRGRGNRALRCAGTAGLWSAVALLATISIASAQPVSYQVQGDGIPVALTEQPGDATRGRDIATNRQVGMCPLCHQLPSTTDRFQGDIASNLAGSGARWSAPQLRLRIVDSRRVNADSVMPAYYKSSGLTRVGANWRDKPLLDAQQIEDIVAWLATLK